MSFGLKIRKKYGKAKPKEIDKKINRILKFVVNEENPMAVPKKGALQGVAINVANIPEKKYSFSVFFFSIFTK